MPENNYSIVQTSENNEVLLSVLPSRWVLKNGWKCFGSADRDVNVAGYNDMCYWPTGVSGYQLLEKAKKDPKIKPDMKVLRGFCCKIKRNNFQSYSEAFREQKIMETNSDTEEYEIKKKVRKATTAADLFKQIQTAKPGPSREAPVPIPDAQVEEATDSSFSEPEIETRIDASRDGSLLLNPTKRDNQSSESGRLPPLEPQGSVNDSFAQEPDLLQLVLSLHKKVDENSMKVEESKLTGNRGVALLSQINAKFDVFASQVNSKLDNLASHKPQQIKLEWIGNMSTPLKPVKSLEELESLEKKSSNAQFVAGIIQYFGSMHGKDRYVGEGGTVCLQIIDYFFQREFLLNCSWTGTTRTKNSDEVTVSKIAFHKFDGVITLFQKVIMFSDPSYSLVECQKFLHRCLRNAKQRFEETKGTRAPVARKRRKRNEHHSAIRSMDNEEDNQDEEDDPLVEEVGPDDVDLSDVKPGFVIEEYLLE